MFEAMDEILKATYKALEPSDEEPFITEDDVLPDESQDEDVMFWPDGAKTRNHELDEEDYWYVETEEEADR